MYTGLWDCRCLGDQSKIFWRSRITGSDAADLRAGLPLVEMHEVLICMLLKTVIYSAQAFSVAQPFPYITILEDRSLLVTSIHLFSAPVHFRGVVVEHVLVLLL